MIPCFPANNSTDAQHCDIVSSRSSPSHFTKDMILLLILPKSEPGQLSYKKIKPLFGKSKRILFEKIEIRGNAHAAIHLRTINQFLKLVYFLFNNSQLTHYYANTQPVYFLYVKNRSLVK